MSYQSYQPAPGSGRARALKPIREGFRAKYVVLPSESKQDFSELCDDLEEEWQPCTRTEQFMVEQMAVSQWKLTRLEIGEVSLYAQELDGRAQLPLICKISALQARLERSYFLAMRQLEHLQTSRRRGNSRYPARANGVIDLPGSRSRFGEDPGARHPHLESPWQKSEMTAY